MGCYSFPLSCLTPERIFAGVYKPNCAGFADPSNFQAERGIFDSAFQEQIHNYGVEIGYYVNTFNLSAMNHVYGEHSTQEYLGPITLKAYVEMDEPSPVYTLAGFDSGDTITAYIHIGTFSSLMSSISSYVYHPIEPKSQDKLIIYPLGCDRVSGRGSKIFDVTDVLDQSTSDELNPVMGHYIWRIKGVRNEHNFETNEPRENVNDQAYDNTFSGKLSSSMYPALSSDEKLYTSNSDDYVQEEVLPPSTGGNDGSVYGQYY